MKKPKSFQTKLWLYFVLFTAIIFIVLWLLQTVFLQSFYNSMLIENTKRAAQQVIAAASSDEPVSAIDALTRENSLLVYITDTEGNVQLISDEYKSTHGKKHGATADEGVPPQGENQGEKPRKNYRSLPENYDTFLQNLASSENGETEYSNSSIYVYGTYVDFTYSDTKSVLYVSVTLNAVGSTVTIIGIQLAIVTAFSLAAGFVLAWFISRRFAKPVSQLSHKASQLGEDGYSADFQKGFCKELDELSDTLDKTSEKFKQSKTFQNELLANVSHDLRTPLTMIKGYAEEVDEYSWQDETQRHADIAVILREADRLTELVNEILAYSELRSQEGAQGFSTVDFSAIANKVADTFESLYRRDGYILERETENRLYVSGNASQLERMVFNLMDNAIRHTGESKRVSVSLRDENGRAVLRITDYGKGIPADQLDSIWERYVTARQRDGKGASDLGLAIVRQIVLLHQGDCTVTSSENVGSTFIIKLPIHFPER